MQSLCQMKLECVADECFGRGGSLSSEKAYDHAVIEEQSDLGPQCFKTSNRGHIVDNI